MRKLSLQLNKIFSICPSLLLSSGHHCHLIMSCSRESYHRNQIKLPPVVKADSKSDRSAYYSPHKRNDPQPRYCFHTFEYLIIPMYLFVETLLTAVLAIDVVLSASASGNACRDYFHVIEYFPNGTSCTTENLPTQEDLDMFNREF